MIADRILLARRKAGFSLRDLAAKMDNRVTAQAIGKYERGEDIPSSGVLIALAKALEVSVTYLMDTQGLVLSGVEFRTKANTTSADRATVETEVLEWIERYLQIEHILDLDSAEWKPPFATLKKLQRIEDSEGLAREVRSKWMLGTDPIPNMTELLEEKGLKVLIVDLPDRVSGFTCIVAREEGSPGLPVIVVNRQFSLERRRLTLAHELAHRVIDPTSLPDKEEEKAANLFAGAFLMPQEHLLREVGKQRNALGYKELIALKRLYRVSGAALLMRLKQIGVINESILTYAFQTIARGWRTHEPEELEEEKIRGERERPRRFERLCYRALAENFVSLSKAAELLRIPLPKVEAGLKGPQIDHADHHQ
ncbi:helix-turn-helix domain-containing protein [Edaphobacter albus]|uniref:helix-turn-helix domain-containing protein n=1 Tax=Edaphobacter sp. 4G125 TaxID=2763071 RepID=UPI0016475B3A|nr:XRE family transcriptional regulator [Edaphobacter sp. 4G125]QNI37694.1 ImmA/IrrE family metallo-endopeptidase [Edaphobacter sp. 4G125]